MRVRRDVRSDCITLSQFCAAATVLANEIDRREVEGCAIVREEDAQPQRCANVEARHAESDAKGRIAACTSSLSHLPANDRQDHGSSDGKPDVEHRAACGPSTAVGAAAPLPRPTIRRAPAQESRAATTGLSAKPHNDTSRQPAGNNFPSEPR